MADFTIIPCLPADFPALSEIETLGDAQFPPGRFPGEPGSDNVPTEELSRGIADGLLWVARSEHAIVDPVAGPISGFLLAAVEPEAPDHLHLRQIVVHPHRQRQGIGRALVEVLLAEARRRGIGRVTLTTFRDIPWNGPWYGRLGFREMDGGELSSPGNAYLQRYLAEQRHAGMTDRIAMIIG